MDRRHFLYTVGTGLAAVGFGSLQQDKRLHPSEDNDLELLDQLLWTGARISPEELLESPSGLAYLTGFWSARLEKNWNRFFFNYPIFKSTHLGTGCINALASSGEGDFVYYANSPGGESISRVKTGDDTLNLVWYPLLEISACSDLQGDMGSKHTNESWSLVSDVPIEPGDWVTTSGDGNYRRLRLKNKKGLNITIIRPYINHLIYGMIRQERKILDNLLLAIQRDHQVPIYGDRIDRQVLGCLLCSDEVLNTVSWAFWREVGFLCETRREGVKV